MKWSRTLNTVVVSTACALVLALAVAPHADAAPLRLRSAPIDYAADGKDIKDVLRDFGASQGLATNISPGVTGTVSGKFHLAPRQFLDTLAASFGFAWYYDGEVLNVVASSDLQSTLIKLDSASTESLRDTLAKMQIADDRFPITYDSTQGTAIVSGPPRYVQLVQQIAERIDTNAQRRTGTMVRVFPLNHGWAQDRTVVLEGDKVTLPGVVSVLNNLYHPDAGKEKDKEKGGGGRGDGRSSGVTRNAPMTDVNGQTYNGPYVPPPLPQGGAANKGMFAGLSGEPSPQLQSAIGQTPPPPASSVPAQGGDGTLPVIVADQRTNSVVIRDTADRMSQYDTLIQRLDVKPQLIEIEAHIIEIKDDALRQLGIDWTAHNSHIDIQTGTGTSTQNGYNGNLTQSFGNTTLPGNVAAAASPVGLSMAAVLGDAGRYLMARVSALQQSDNARIDASPKVITVNNIEAIMDNKTQFFVPVQGYTSGDLYSISTGISLRVLPMVLEEDGQTRIKLDVAIEDGEVSTTQTVGNLPVIQTSNINTQAFINEGQALLIAGYRADTDESGVTGVPYLSKIPLLGALFRTDNRTKNHMERLFLLSPRVITP
ncbi:type III secretion system outer membrane ring subunit SctC [Paraburkholderia flava]|uniref:type III secretion system outer membrane ring subunit SctC n=1 Tax=Paraburkholderia flava TaxID=2547393 RepID=UPI00105F6C7A|nr:type III secretion system outer membrane ring subunit SctC [Paraburkholderia flava]